MEQEKVTYFLALYGRYYPQEKTAELIDKLKALPDESFEKLLTAPKKDPLSVLSFSMFIGYFGIDRIMLGQIGKGLLKLLILGVMCILAYFAVDTMPISEIAKWILALAALGVGCIWAMLDWFKIERLTKEYNWRLISQLL